MPDNSCIVGTSTSELSASSDDFSLLFHHGGDDVVVPFTPLAPPPPSDAVRYDERDCSVPSEAVTNASSSVVFVDDLKLEFHS